MANMSINNPDTTPQALQSYTLLQIAAEAFLGVDREAAAKAPGITIAPILKGNETLLSDGNLHSSKMTVEQAVEFAKNWKVVSHQPNTATGFSATLFEYICDQLNQSFAGKYVDALLVQGSLAAVFGNFQPYGSKGNKERRHVA